MPDRAASCWRSKKEAMSEPTSNSQPDPADADAMRQHAETDVEGGDASEQGADAPREHTEDPAEG
jgi:hypothetical protein